MWYGPEPPFLYALFLPLTQCDGPRGTAPKSRVRRPAIPQVWIRRGQRRAPTMADVPGPPVAVHQQKIRFAVIVVIQKRAVADAGAISNRRMSTYAVGLLRPWSAYRVARSNSGPPSVGSRLAASSRRCSARRASWCALKGEKEPEGVAPPALATPATTRRRSPDPSENPEAANP